MLSKVAERLYWLARYLERAENTARLVNAYSSLMLDLPRGIGMEWKQIVTIMGNSAQFERQYRSAGERNVLKFVLIDTRNRGSLMTSLTAARENVRTTRDRMPSETWEHVNELYLFAKRRFAAKTLRKRQHDVLTEIIMRCQQITGLLAGTMSHGHGYQFVRLGRNLERADMTTRMLDVGSTALMAPASELAHLENGVWINVLRSLSAHLMYRQNVRRRVSARTVVNYLLHDPKFPRAVAHCFGEMESCLQQLPQNRSALRKVRKLQRLLAETDDQLIEKQGLNDCLDTIQKELIEVHALLQRTWFVPRTHDAA